MNEEKSQIQQMKPYIIAAAVLLVLLIILMLWPSSDTPSQAELEAASTEQSLVDAQPSVPEQALPSEPEQFEAPQMPSEVVIGEGTNDIEVLAPVIEQAEEVSLDISDAAVKAAVVQAIRSPAISRFLVDESLLQKFVINVNDLANQEITIKDNLLVAPEQEFKVYQQAQKIFMDRSSFARYTPYVEALESADTDSLLNAYEEYKPSLSEKFAEISRPGENLDNTLIKAIDELLATPTVEYPVEIVSETVMYKFADPKLESLSGPQKQMIRMGPDNMRRLKVVLSRLKAELEAR